MRMVTRCSETECQSKSWKIPRPGMRRAAFGCEPNARNRKHAINYLHGASNEGRMTSRRPVQGTKACAGQLDLHRS